MSIGPQRPESLIGRVIAGYELTAYLGTGATGLVFRGKRAASAPPLVEKTGVVPTIFPDDAAIKLLAPPLGATEEELADFQRRFAREARTLKQLDHPHILPLVDFGEDPDANAFYMILPYMAGGSLAEVIRAQGPLPLAQAETILAQIADALDYAHGKDIVHRDVKPANILLDAAGKPYLADFGIARLLSDSATQRTATGRMMGTPAYMAPEQFDDSSRVGPAADTYSLGMVAYEMVTGKVAFGATSWAQVMKQQLQETPTPPRSIQPNLPEPAEAAIMKALAKQPELRFTTATAFAQAFDQGAQGQWAEGLTRFVAPGGPLSPGSSAQTLPNNAPPLPARESRRARLELLGAGVAALLVVACLSGLFFRNGLQSGNGPLPGGGPGALANATQSEGASPAASGTPGARPTTSHGGNNGGGVTASPTPVSSPTPSLPSLVISTDAGQSTDGQSHGSGNPFYFSGNNSYGNVTIQAGAWATAISHCTGGGSGVARFSASGTVTIAGTLTVSGLGYCGGKAIQGAGGGMQGESYSGSSQKQSGANYGGGGGGGGADSGGAGGGYGTSGASPYNDANAGIIDTSVIGGNSYGDPSLSTLFLGSGGGSSGAQSGCQGGAGGNGGGAVAITAKTIIVTGHIYADGSNGASVANTTNNYRGGGGGSGGSILLHAASITIGSGLVIANGGNGGYGIWDNTRVISGGSGGVGRIRIEYTQSFSGSTSPAASVAHV